MNLVKSIKKIFTKKPIEINNKKELKTLETIDIFDDVLIKIDDNVYKG